MLHWGDCEDRKAFKKSLEVADSENVMSRYLQDKSNHDKESSFFSELSSSIKYASILDSELNRRLAHEFNIFDFLRDDEIGLSQIIADLLNPLASHGQGTFFLQRFLEFVKSEKNWNHLTSNTVNVETEHSTYKGRRIDIYAEILGETPFVLAIENKPYAGDQENQVLDYLKYLEGKTSDYLLVYLSSDGQGPSERSLPQIERSEWMENFTVMAYAESDDDPDQSQDTEEKQSNVKHEEENQEVKSLEAWLKICKEKCEVDRLRWFLGDAEKFCTKTFGNSKSTDDVEVRIVEEFLLEKENQKYLNAAYAVNKAWPNVVNKVAEIFFRQLTERIKIEITKNYSARNDLKFNFSLTFDEDRKGYIYMYLYSTNWVESKNGKFHTENRYGIVLTNETKNTPDKWYVGVESPKKKEHMEHHEQYRFEEVKVKLNALKIPRIEGDDYSDPGYIYAEDDKQNWEQFLKKLLDESEQKRGEISDYYVRFFCKFAGEAISILDEIE